MLQTSDPEALLRVALSALLSYLVVILVLRLTGKRTLSKWNAFDFIVTIALGSILASVIVSKNVPVMDGVVALASLVLLQYLITWFAVRLGWLDRAIKSRPRLLLHRGHLDLEAMRHERVPEAEIYAALRGHGVTDLDEVEAVVLETDGSFSVLKRRPGKELTTLKDVIGHPEEGEHRSQAEAQAEAGQE